jgi:hypothetical protein
MTTILSSLPWNTSPITDEATWRAYMRLARGTGVIPEDLSDPDVLNGFLVYADSTGLQVKIKSGTAWMRGVYAPNPSEKIEAIGFQSGPSNRIDRVALKLDTVNHKVTIEVVQGAPASSPSAPVLTNTTSTYYVKLAQVYVHGDATTIVAGDVTDERYFSYADANAPISKKILTAAAASIEFTEIPNTYQNLKIVLSGQATKTATVCNIRMQFNSDSGANYDYQLTTMNAAAVATSENFGIAFIYVGDLPAASSAAYSKGSCEILIPDYTDTIFHKTTHIRNASKFGVATGNLEDILVAGFWRSVAAINAIKLYPSANNFLAGTKAILYGLR